MLYSCRLAYVHSSRHTRVARHAACGVHHSRRHAHGVKGTRLTGKVAGTRGAAAPNREERHAKTSLPVARTRLGVNVKWYTGADCQLS